MSDTPCNKLNERHTPSTAVLCQHMHAGSAVSAAKQKQRATASGACGSQPTDAIHPETRSGPRAWSLAKPSNKGTSCGLFSWVAPTAPKSGGGALQSHATKHKRCRQHTQTTSIHHTYMCCALSRTSKHTKREQAGVRPGCNRLQPQLLHAPSAGWSQQKQAHMQPDMIQVPLSALAAAAFAVPCHGCTLQTDAHMICAGCLAGFPAGVCPVATSLKPGRVTCMQLRTNGRQNGPWCEVLTQVRCFKQNCLQQSFVDEAGTPEAVLQRAAKTDAG